MDESSENIPKQIPHQNANFLSRILFWWNFPLLLKGLRSKVNLQHLYAPPSHYKAEYLHGQLQKAWKKQTEQTSENKKPTLRRAIFSMIWKKLLFFGFVYVSKFYILGTINVICMGLIIRCIENGIISGLEFDLPVIAVIVTFAFGSICFQHITYHLELLGMTMRLSGCSMVFRKALRLSKALMATTTAGKFFNVVAGDVFKFDMVTIYCLSVWIEPFAVVIITACLYTLYGVSILPGAGILYLYAIFLVAEGRAFKKLRLKKSTATDERLKVTNGILSDIKAIKMYSWEAPFAELLNRIRRRELKYMAMSFALRTINMVVYTSGAKLSLFLSILTSVYLGEDIRAERIFAIYAVYNILKLNLLYIFPNAVQKIAEVLVTIDRLQTILIMDEKNQDKLVQHTPILNNEVKSIEVRDLTATWGQGNLKFHLTTLNLFMSGSELCFITGPVGSGKSSILMALLGEMVYKSGKAKIKGKISYVSQEPWLFPASIKKNIIFSLPYDETRYKKVLEACALTEDLSNFPEGDSSHVGDKGVTLSGGQKARINLARAMYQEADIYLMDDCLSAVDARVGNHLFQTCINGLIGNSLRILATHQLQYITLESNVIVMKNGSISQQGNYAAIINEDNKQKSAEFRNPLDILNQVTFSVDNLQFKDVRADDNVDEEDTKDISRSKNFVEETYATGISFKAYYTYLSSAHNFFTLTFFILINIASQLINIQYELWLVTWTEAEIEASNNMLFTSPLNESFSNSSTLNNSSFIFSNATQSSLNIDFLNQNLKTTWDAFIVFLYITIGVLSISLIRTVMFFTFAIKASSSIHKGLINAILRSKMSFFNQNPLGRIINRFSKDMEAVDDILPPCFYDEIVELTTLLEVVVIIIYINYWLAIPTFLVGSMIAFTIMCYWKTASFVKRIEAISRSPVFTLMSNTIQGQVTIRAHKAEAILATEFDNRQDSHTSAWYSYLSVTRWFSCWMELLLLAFIAKLLVAAVLVSEGFTGSGIGVVITLVTRLSSIMQWGIKQAAEAETQITGVERISEYSNLPSEDGYDNEMPDSVPKDWPTTGAISFLNVSLYYSMNDPPVLKNLNFSIRSGEKIGIVGRTGAGKSSLITALFRLSHIRGDIYIDGQNTASLPLSTLRKSFSIIPQDPVLFSGSVRFNLDPFSEFSDDDLWQALEEAQAKNIIQQMSEGLNDMVAEGGSNFSVGQRQLLCLARAILRKNKIILLDEATSNIDRASDETIQNVLKKRFQNCTILIIAHRLDTIMDVDRVMVMHEGELIEFDEPYTLLQKESSFSNLVNQTGKVAASRLINIAHMHHLYVKNISEKE